MVIQADTGGRLGGILWRIAEKHGMPPDLPAANLIVEKLDTETGIDVYRGLYKR